MKVGDLVKHSGKNDVVWYGVITEKKKYTYERIAHLNALFCVVWTFGVEGWFYSHELEVLSESR